MLGRSCVIEPSVPALRQTNLLRCSYIRGRCCESQGAAVCGVAESVAFLGLRRFADRIERWLGDPCGTGSYDWAARRCRLSSHRSVSRASTGTSLPPGSETHAAGCTVP